MLMTIRMISWMRRVGLFQHVADPVEDQDDREDPKEDQQPLLVVLEDVRGRRQESSDGQFTPTT